MRPLSGMFVSFSSGFAELCLCLKMFVQPVFTNQIKCLAFSANKISSEMKMETSREMVSRLFPALFHCRLTWMFASM